MVDGNCISVFWENFVFTLVSPKRRRVSGCHLKMRYVSVWSLGTLPVVPGHTGRER